MKSFLFCIGLFSLWILSGVVFDINRRAHATTTTTHKPSVTNSEEVAYPNREAKTGTGNNVVAAYVELLERHIKLQDKSIAMEKDYLEEIKKNKQLERELERSKSYSPNPVIILDDNCIPQTNTMQSRITEEVKQ